MAQQDVEQAKADLEAVGVSLAGACGAVKLTNLVAWRLRPRYALLGKSGGNRGCLLVDGSCLTGDETSDPGYATDYLIDTAAGYVGYDILGDGGGLNTPQWAGPETAPDMVERNRANAQPPLDPAGYYAETPDTVPPVEPPPETSDDDVLTQLAIVIANQDAAAATQAADTAAILTAVDSVLARLNAIVEDIEDSLRQLGIVIAIRRWPRDEG
jgi:hypothetical protein